MQALLQDFRFSCRQLRRSPGFAFTAVLTLALGIGAVTSIFSVIDEVLLKPFAFREPGKLVVIREVVRELSKTSPAVPDNYLHYLRLKRDAKTIEDAAIFQDHGVSIAVGGDRPNIVGSLVVSPNFLSVLGVEPILGRNFTPQEATVGKNNVVMLSYSAWQRFFDADPKVLGRTLSIGGDANTIVGVLPPSFRFPVIAMAPNMPAVFAGGGALRSYEILQPLAPYPNDLQDDSYDYNYRVIARLRPNVTVAEARAELDALQKAHTLAAHLPVHLGISVQPLAADVTSGVSGELWLLFAAAGSVLLIACANLANLQLARAVSRERETAVRAALGASRLRLIRSRLMESVVLALIGGSAGSLLSTLGVKLLLAVAPANIPRIHEVHVNWIVLIFAAVLSVITAFLFGILPALRSLRASPQQAMQTSSARTTDTREGAATRSLVVASEIACAVVLLIVTGLALRSFSHLLRQGRSFDAGHLTLAEVDLYAPQYGDSHKNVNEIKLAFIDRVLDALRQLPGVQSAAISSAMPLTGETWIDGIKRPDHPLPEGQQPNVNVRWVSPDYFSVLGIRLLEGRLLTAADRNQPPRVVISEKTARDVFPGQDPIGKTVTGFALQTGPVTVIGVVADARVNTLKSVAPMVYVPYWLRAPWTVSFIVRSSGSTEGLADAMRRSVWKVDPQVAIPVVKSMDEQMNDSVATDRFATVLLSSFGVAALLLALLGVYGVLAYSVTLRQQEFGIRIALGSDQAKLIRLVLRQASYPVLGGLLCGVIASFVATRWVHSLLYEAKTADPFAISAGILLLLSAALTAAVLPARRAAQVDPMQVLRNE